MKKLATNKTGKRSHVAHQRLVKPRQRKTTLKDVVAAAHAAGAKVSVSLEPKTKPYWHVSYIASTGKLMSFDVVTGLGAVEMVARMINLDATSISIQRGQLNEVA